MSPSPTSRMHLPVIALTAAAAVAFAAADLLNPGYDPIAETASRYVNGTAGWLIPTALVALAAAAVALHRRLRGGAGRVALLVFAAGVGIAALFPADPPGQYHRPSTSELVHGLAAWAAFIALPVAALLLTRTIAAGADRRRLRIAAWATVAATGVFAVFLIDVMGGPSLRIGASESLVGLTERIALAADLVWLALAATSAGRASVADQA